MNGYGEDWYRLTDDMKRQRILWYFRDDPKRRDAELVKYGLAPKPAPPKPETAKPPVSIAPRIVVVTPSPVKPAPKPKPTAAGTLIRVSTEDQSRYGYSKQDQLEWARSEASRLGLPLIEYVEEGGSHSDMLDRERLNAFEQDVVDGKVGTLLLRYGDRLGRGAVFTKLLEWLKAWGVVIRCGDMPQAGDATDTLMAFYGSQGSQFLKTLRQRTKQGVANAQAAGKHAGGNLLGFRWEDGRWTPEAWALVLDGTGSDLPPWQQQRIRQAVKAYQAGPAAFSALLEKRRSSSLERHMAARKRQEERNNIREAWLLNHRPILIDRVSL